MLEKFIRRLNQPREKRDRVYNRYLCWCAGRIGKNRQTSSAYRDEQLAVRNFNDDNRDGHYD